MTIRVTDSLSNGPEHIIEAAKAIGRSTRKRKVFDEVYRHKMRTKSVEEISRLTGLTRMQVLQAGGDLQKSGIIQQTKKNNETAYSQISFFQHNKSKIIRLVEQPDRIISLATKRNVQTSGADPAVPRKSSSSTRSRRRKDKLRVLYLTASPQSQSYLRTEAEFRSVQRELRGSKFRDDIVLFISPAADTKSLLDGINDHRPQIVHFSGHGGQGSIWLDDGKVENSVGQPMNFELLNRTLGATSTPPTLLVLNACDTLDGADKMLSSVRVIVAMSDSISDIGAATFASQFYGAIASGQPIQSALEQGKIAMEAAMLSDAQLPTMICRPDVNPSKLRLVN